MNKIGAVLLLAALVIVAGCGSTVRTIVKTQRVEPCATKNTMTGCVRALFREAIREAGDVATLRVSCEREGDHWSCLRFIDYGSDTSDCSKLTIRRVGVGVPFLAASVSSFDCPWTS